MLRTPLGPDVSFSDDPLRMLRAARFIAGYDLQPTDELVAAWSSMAPRLEIVSAERIRDELDKLMVARPPGSRACGSCIDTGLADQFLPELPAMRLEHDPIHRHKDVLTHTIAVVENVRPPHEQPGGPHRRSTSVVTRLAALFHDVGKPRTRGYQQGQGHDVPPPRRGRRPHDAEADEGAALLERRRRRGHRARRAAPALPHVPDGLDATPPCGATCATPAPLLNELNVLTRCDCTTRNERKAAQLAKRMDDLEDRIDALEPRPRSWPRSGRSSTAER